MNNLDSLCSSSTVFIATFIFDQRRCTGVKVKHLSKLFLFIINEIAIIGEY